MSMLEGLKKFERVIAYALIAMMTLVLTLSTVELGWIIIKDIVTPPIFLLKIDELLEIFGLFMLVLIGIELLETIAKTYLEEGVIRVEVVLVVAIIAIARKVIILDVQELSSLTLIGMATVIIALAGGYFLLKRSR